LQTSVQQTGSENHSERGVKSFQMSPLLYGHKTDMVHESPGQRWKGKVPVLNQALCHEDV